MNNKYLLCIIVIATIFLHHPVNAAKWELVREFPATRLYLDTDSIRGDALGPKEAWFNFEYKEPDCTLITRPEKKCLTSMYVFERYYSTNISCRMATELHFTDGTTFSSRHECEPHRFYVATVSGDQWKSLYPSPIPDYVPRLEPKTQSHKLIYRCQLNFDNGDLYNGDCVNGQQNGKGVMMYSDGSRYDGDWIDGTMNGNCIFISVDGSRYEGQVFNGTRSGRGIMTFGPNTKWAGDRYEGFFDNNAMNGKGTYKWADGRWYEGDFVNNTRTGYGTEYAPNGSVIKQGLFKNGELVK